MAMSRRSIAGRISIVGVGVLLCGVLSAWTPPPHHSGELLGGSFDGKTGPYRTIQSAVDAAKAGDFILVGPGDYHETADETGPPVDPGQGRMGGVFIDKPDI